MFGNTEIPLSCLPGLEATSDSNNLYPIPDTSESIAIMEAAIQGQIKKLMEQQAE
jgi:hypothetical protein